MARHLNWLMETAPTCSIIDKGYFTSKRTNDGRTFRILNTVDKLAVCVFGKAQVLQEEGVQDNLLHPASY